MRGARLPGTLQGKRAHVRPGAQAWVRGVWFWLCARPRPHGLLPATLGEDVPGQRSVCGERGSLHRKQWPEAAIPELERRSLGLFFLTSAGGRRLAFSS